MTISATESFKTLSYRSLPPTASKLKGLRADSNAIREAIGSWTERGTNLSISKPQLKRTRKELDRLYRLLRHTLPCTTMANTPRIEPARLILTINIVSLRELSDYETRNLTRRANEIKQTMDARRALHPPVEGLLSEYIGNIRYL